MRRRRSPKRRALHFDRRPAQAGTQYSRALNAGHNRCDVLDARFRGHDVNGLHELYPTNPAAEFTRGPNRISGVISSTVLQPQYTIVVSSSFLITLIALAAPA